MVPLTDPKTIAMATTTAKTTTITLLFVFLTMSPVMARPHVRPALTLADLDADGAIPENDAAELSELGQENNGHHGGGGGGGGGGEMNVVDAPKTVVNEVRFDAVDLPSHFGTYDLNRDRKVSIKELSIVTGTKELDAMAPFHAADTNNDEKISFDEFQHAPWIFGATREVEVVDEFIRDVVGGDV